MTYKQENRLECLKKIAKKLNFGKTKLIIFFSVEICIAIEALIRIGLYRPDSNVSFYLTVCVL